MSLKQDVDVHISTHLESLKSLHTTPSGLADQFAEVSAMLASYDAEVTKIETNRDLSTEGKAAQLKAAHDVAHAAVERWKTSKTTGSGGLAARGFASTDRQATARSIGLASADDGAAAIGVRPTGS
jgi:hypothetical protein